MPIKLANNASTRLAVPITSTATTVSAESGGGDKFPVTGDGVYFPMTLVASDGSLEIVKCTARSGDAFTVERAQEGTTAKDFSAGSVMELRLTAGALEAVMGELDEAVEQATQALEDRIDTVEGYKAGDYLSTARNPGVNWLKRDGGAYDKTDYPDLATLMPDAPATAITQTYDQPAGWMVYRNSGAYQKLIIKDNLAYVLLCNASNGVYLWTFNLETKAWAQVSGLIGTINPTNEASTFLVMAFDGDSTLVVTDIQGQLKTHYSTDMGVTWNTSSTYSGGIIRNVAYDEINGQFVGVGHGTTSGAKQVYRSSNGGASWTSTNVTTSGTITKLSVANGKIWISGLASGGFAFVSHNGGVSFTEVTIPAATSVWSQTLISYFNGTYYVAMNNGGSLLSSNDLSSFVAVTNMTGLGQTQVLFSNDIGIYNQSASVSMNGTDWTTHPIAGSTGMPSGYSSQSQFMTMDDEYEKGRFYGILLKSTGPILRDEVKFFIMEFPEGEKFIVPNDNPTNGWIKAK